MTYFQSDLGGMIRLLNSPKNEGWPRTLPIIQLKEVSIGHVEHAVVSNQSVAESGDNLSQAKF